MKKPVRAPRRARPEARTAAVYLRVSKGEQKTQNQRPDIDRIVAARGLRVVEVFEEHASAGKARRVFDGMLDAARRGEFKVLVVWALDRFGRSMPGNLAAVLELDRLGVEVISVRESWLETQGPTRVLLIAVLSWVAEQERARIGDRTRAGLERARRRGSVLGRPRRAFMLTELEHARRLKGKGISIRKIARRLRVPHVTLHRALQTSTAERGKRPGSLPSEGSPSLTARGGARSTVDIGKGKTGSRRRQSLGWTRVDPRPWSKTNAKWRHEKGWRLEHCGHPTANTPWDLHDAKGVRHLTGASSGNKRFGTAWPNLATAMDYVSTFQKRGRAPGRAR